MKDVMRAFTVLFVAAVAFAMTGGPVYAQTPGKKPNILVIWGDDIGQFNVSAYNMGMMGYKTPNIDSIAKAGVVFTDWYGEQSCTAGRAALLQASHPFARASPKLACQGRPKA